MYIYFVHIVRRTKRLLWRALYWLPSAVLAAAYVYYIYLGGDNPLSDHTQGIGRMAIAVMALAAPKLVFMLCSLVGVGVHYAVRICPRWPFTAVGAVLATVSFCNILYGCFYGIKRLEVKEVEYCSTRIPEGFDGYRIVQLSDLHTGSWETPEVLERLVKLVNAQSPDLIVFTGDLVELDGHPEAKEGRRNIPSSRLEKVDLMSL